MPRHEQYEELCTLAMIGELSSTELQDLKSHLDECAECRQEYREFVQFVLPQLSLASEAAPPPEMKTSDRQAIRARFLKRAASSGVPFSEAAVAGKRSTPKTQFGFWRPLWGQPTLRYGLATGFAAILVIAAWHQARRSDGSARARPLNSQVENLAPAPPVQPVQPAPASQPDSETTIADLREQLRDTAARLIKTQTSLDTAKADRTEMQGQFAKQYALLQKAENDREDAATANVDLQTRVEGLQKRESELEADYTSQLISVTELTQKLNEQRINMQSEHQLVSTDSEVRELMASRNLHIVDVFDADGRGKQKPIFGRVFYAENRKLIFYAYDLNSSQDRDVRMDYHVWGQREGPGQSARSLGRFRPDDLSRGRWVFELDNGKLLSEIDSIFVTVEKSDAPRSQPKGQKLMYAYLRDHPNHP